MLSDILRVLRGKPLVSISDVMAFLPVHVRKMHGVVSDVVGDLLELKKTILSISSQDRTYANTVAAYDELNGLLFSATSMATLVRHVSGEVQTRGEPYQILQKEGIEILKDRAFYDAFCAYRDNGKEQEELSAEQECFFAQTMKDFSLAGYDLDAASFDRVKALSQDIQALCNDFDMALNNDVTRVAFFPEELSGIAADYITAQSRDEQGKVLLACNKTTMTAILSHCTNPGVRKAFKRAYDQRAFPQNAETLQKLLCGRSELAQLLGFENYAALALSRYMAGSPEAIKKLLQQLFESAEELAARDMRNICSSLPADVVLSPDGKLQPWDLLYAQVSCEKKNYSVDQRLISEYFPIDKVFGAIFAIYEKFMGLSFEYHAHIPGGWHESLQGVTVYTKDRSRQIGFVLFDLFPRPQKYFHACCLEVVPRARRHDLVSGLLFETPSVSVIIANLPLPRGDAPALFLHSDVTTFFHEFGHAVHNLLSSTAHLQTSGSMGVMLDFIELPSQILEEWMWRGDMLKLVSGHYKTGEPLPDDLIQKMTSMRRSGRRFFEMNQVYQSMLSLVLHEVEPPVDLDGVIQAQYERFMRHMAWDPDNKFYASFSHLTMYGPAYYAYTISRLYAYEVFARIEKVGLLNEEIGKEFVEKILRPGGSLHPFELLADFLGQPASPQAYMQWLARDEK